MQDQDTADASSIRTALLTTEIKSRSCETDADVVARALLIDSGLLDPIDYRSRAKLPDAVDAAQHYLTHGWMVGHEPSSYFEGNFLYPYYRTVGHFDCPALAYLALRAAGWPVYPTRADAEHVAAVLRASDLFDGQYYLRQLRKPPPATDPVLHYLLVGERLGYHPSDRFDPVYYSERNPDVDGSGLNMLAHYIAHGRGEGRVTRPALMDLPRYDHKQDPQKPHVLIVCHQASRTGAPILGYNIGRQLSAAYNITTLLLAGGELEAQFKSFGSVFTMSLAGQHAHQAEVRHSLKFVLESKPFKFAIVNSIESRSVIAPLLRLFIPIITLMHEFAVYVRPRAELRAALDCSTATVFPAEIVRQAALKAHQTLAVERTHVLCQGPCSVPRSGSSSFDPNRLRNAIRPNGTEDAFIVLGAGTVEQRKGVDLFVACAAAVRRMKTKRPVRFVWIGHGYDPDKISPYSGFEYVASLAEQIERSQLRDSFTWIDPVESLDAAYDEAGVFFLSSRLDPFPNVTIDATLRGLPVVCFQGASGTAEMLAQNAVTAAGLAPYADVQAAAEIIVHLANHPSGREKLSRATADLARSAFDLDVYVQRIDSLAKSLAGLTEQCRADFETIRADSSFDENFFSGFGNAALSRDDSICQFLVQWSTAWRQSSNAESIMRKPYAGFNPLIYARKHDAGEDFGLVNPLAHYIRSGKVVGPWCHDVLTPFTDGCGEPPPDASFAIHAHFTSAEAAEAFLRSLRAQQLRCDVLLSAESQNLIDELRDKKLRHTDKVHIQSKPVKMPLNGLLQGFSDQTDRYALIGHFHDQSGYEVCGAPSHQAASRFLWQHVLGGFYPMVNVILNAFARDRELGLVFAENPFVCWPKLSADMPELADAVITKERLLPRAECLTGGIFWLRSNVLQVVKEALFPQQPLTSPHEINRLLPDLVQQAGYSYSTTYIVGLSL